MGINFSQINKSKVQHGSMMKRVRNEVEIHCQLKHPSILEVRFNYFTKIS